MDGSHEGGFAQEKQEWSTRESHDVNPAKWILLLAFSILILIFILIVIVILIVIELSLQIPSGPVAHRYRRTWTCQLARLRDSRSIPRPNLLDITPSGALY